MSARERIIQYHQLCAINAPRNHAMSVVKDADMKAIFAQSEISSYFKTVDDRLVVRETVVGGKDKKNIIELF